MATPLADALAEVRADLLDPGRLIRAVGSGRQRGRDPGIRRVDLRYVDVKAGRHLQVTRYDDTQAHTANVPVGAAAEEEVDRLLAAGFGNWHVETTGHTAQLRVTKKGAALVHSRPAHQPVAERQHDRRKQRMLPEDDPVLAALGLADEHGRIKPSRRDKYRQVEEFLRLLDAAIGDALAKRRLRTPTTDDPLRVVDLGCGNAYLTFAAHRLLTESRQLPVRLVGVDTKEQSRRHNVDLATRLGIDADFVVGEIATVSLPTAPEVVLALHACDTATDEALARAVEWRAPLVLAAPCCHHDIAAQLRRVPSPSPYRQITRYGILRERLADTVTDALRASLLRLCGYRVEVVEFVASEHTPRNTLIRAVAGRADEATLRQVREEYVTLIADWSIRPRLADLVDLPDLPEVRDA